MIARFTEHKRSGYHHIVVLTDYLNKKKALDLEENLQNYIRDEGLREHAVWCKYDPKTRGYSHRPSVGGTDHPATLKCFSVYMVWSEFE
jgi:hypothetical protein